MKFRATRRIAGGAALLLCGLALAACSDQQPTAVEPAAEPAVDADLASRVAAMGFRADMIVDRGDYVVVEGDIRIRKADLMPPSTNRLWRGTGPHFQWHTTNLVSQGTMARGLRVSLSGISGNSAWTTAVREAMQQWNWTWGSKVYLTEASPADISFSFDPYLQAIAVADFPANGLPGPTVKISPNYGSLSASQKRWVMVHEIGHTLGFRHTDWIDRNEESDPEHYTYGAHHIPGTPTGSDPASVFRGGGGSTVPSWNGFSQYDGEGYRYLYPAAEASLLSQGVNGAGNPTMTWGWLSDIASYNVVRTRYYEEWVCYDDPQTCSSGGYEYVSYQDAPVSVSSTSYTDTGASGPGLPWCYVTYDIYPVYLSGKQGIQATTNAIDAC